MMLRREVDAWWASPHVPDHAVALEDNAEQANPKVFIRGNPDTPGEEVPRRFLQLVSGDKREPFKTGSGRLEMAKAIERGLMRKSILLLLIAAKRLAVSRILGKNLTRESV